MLTIKKMFNHVKKLFFLLKKSFYQKFNKMKMQKKSISLFLRITKK